MGDILEPVVLRILLDHQHVIGNQTNVTMTSDDDIMALVKELRNEDENA